MVRSYNFLALLMVVASSCSQSTDEEAAKEWLAEYNQQAEAVYSKEIDAAWIYNTNITMHNQNVMIAESTKSAKFTLEAATNASRDFAWQGFQDFATKREFQMITDIGAAVLPDEKYQEYSEVGANLSTIYSTAKVCNKPNDPSGACYPLDPDLSRVIATSSDWNELVWAWQGWRNESGRKMPDLYEDFIQLQNEAAVLNGFPDGGAYWRSWYETADFRDECERLWQQILPLYQQLHAFVLKRLKGVYPNNAADFPATGQIPAHILGNMWAQQWNGIERFVRPYPGKPGFDVTDELVRQGYDAHDLFILSEDFFTSIGLIPMPPRFWSYSMIEKPADGREVVCHASAWDYLNRRDFRIKQCTEVDHDWLLTTHHEMGHVQYFLQYQNQPVKFRNGANPGFHEAIGDVMSLSVNTPEHLYKIGLLPEVTTDPEQDLNFLMNQALAKIAFIPFGYLIDLWRWDVFDGTTPRQDYNKHWWELRCKYQGVSSPVPRSGTDFDPGAKYHVPNNTPYIRYFVSHIIQFQFHKALCDAAKVSGPLHRCDIYRSPEAGQLIGDMMKLGSSLPWPDALERITGSRTMDAQPLVEYFQPLLDWLQIQNENSTIGWEDNCPNMPTSRKF